jgi:SHS2 domain-containing protein
MTEKKYEYLPDVATADIAFKAQGKDLDEMFLNSALATADIMMDLNTVEPKKIKEVKLENEDLEQLLFEFLSELVFYKDAEFMFFSKFEVKISGSKLKAKMYGNTLNNKMIFKNDIKAITMHMLKIEKKKEKYIATVVVDI